MRGQGGSSDRGGAAGTQSAPFAFVAGWRFSLTLGNPQRGAYDLVTTAALMGAASASVVASAGAGLVSTAPV